MLSRRLIMTSLGHSRIVLPKHIIDVLGWQKGEPIRIEQIEDSIVLTAVAPHPPRCRATEADTTTFKGDCR